MVSGGNSKGLLSTAKASVDASTTPLEILVSKLGMHAELSDDDRAALLALPHTTRTLDAGAFIVREGQRSDEHIVLVSGYAYKHKLTAEGTRQIISIHIPGEALACSSLFLDVVDHNTQALTAAKAAFIPRSAFRKLVSSHPAIAHAILMITLIEASIMGEWLLNIGRRDARARVAHLLCEFGARLDAAGRSGEGLYELPMTQEQLGDALGLTSVHVNRMLKVLRADGLIERDGRRINFLRWDALRKVGDFSDTYLHLDQSRGRGY